MQRKTWYYEKWGGRQASFYQIWSVKAKFDYTYEVNWQLVTENGSLTPICSLSKRSLSPSLTVHEIRVSGTVEGPLLT